LGHFFAPVGGTSVTNPGRKQKKKKQGGTVYFPKHLQSTLSSLKLIIHPLLFHISYFYWVECSTDVP